MTRTLSQLIFGLAVLVAPAFLTGCSGEESKPADTPAPAPAAAPAGEAGKEAPAPAPAK